MFDNLQIIVSCGESFSFDQLPESTNIIMLTSREADVLDGEADICKGHDPVLILRPVLVTLGGALLNDSVEHDDGLAALLPDHRPEVRRGPRQRTLGQDVRPVLRVHGYQAGVDVVRVGDVA